MIEDLPAKDQRALIASLQKQLISLCKPKKGDIYANQFGTILMLMSKKRVVVLAGDGRATCGSSTKSWADVVANPIFSKVSTIRSLLNGAGLIGQ